MTASAAKQPAILEVPLSELVPSPFNARKHFDRDQLAELAGSIRSEGIQQPLIVRNVDGRYQIIAGERRFRAAKLADLDRVPCLVRDVDEPEARRIQIIENLQREGIGPLEEAQAFQDLLRARGVESSRVVNPESAASRPTVDELAKELGKSKEYVYGRLKLLKLGKAAKKSLELGRITAGHAVELVPLDEAKQDKALTYIREMASDGETVSVKALRDEIKYSINPPPKPKPDAGQAARDKKFREQQAKQQAQWKKQEEARRRQSEHDRVIRGRAMAQLWAKLNHKDNKSEPLIEELVSDFAHSDRLGLAQRVAAGKPLTDDYVREDLNAFARLGLHARLALCVLGIAIDRDDYDPKANEALFKWAKIDRKKIAAEIAAQGKAKAKTDGFSAADKRNGYGVSTSAKSQSKPKAKAKHAAKKKGKK